MLTEDALPPSIAKLPAPLHHLALETANRLLERGYEEEEAVAKAVAEAQQESAERHPYDVDLAQADKP